MGVGAGRQGRRRLGRAERVPPGRRLARDRADGRDLVAARRRTPGARSRRSSTGCTWRCYVAAAIASRRRDRRRRPPALRRGDARPRRRSAREPERGASVKAAVDCATGAGSHAARGCRRRSAATAIVDAALARLLDDELRGSDDRRDRPRGRDLRADPLPALPLEAGRSTSRASSRLAAAARRLAGGSRRRGRPRRAGSRPPRARPSPSSTAVGDPVDLWIQALHGGGRRPGDPRGGAARRRGGARVRRQTLESLQARGVVQPTAMPRPRHGSSSRGCSCRPSPTALGDVLGPDVRGRIGLAARVARARGARAT